MTGAVPPVRRLVAVVVAAMVLGGPLVACSGDDGGGADPGAETTTSTTTTEVEPPPPTEPRPEPDPTPDTEPAPVVELGTHAVGLVRLDLVDASRDTEANISAPATEGRVLPTLVLYPAVGDAPEDPRSPTVTDDADPLDGRFPMVVFSHGVTAQSAFYRGFLAAFASAGYVVVAPDHPLSWTGAPGGSTVSDVGNQPGDVSFLIDTFTDDDPDGPAAAVAPMVDPERIAAGGHSLGAITALGAGFGPGRADPRIDAVVGWAGTAVLLSDGPAPDTADRPVLLIHGTADTTVPHDRSETAFGLLTGPRWFVTLPGAGHVDPYLALASNARSELVGRVTLAFLDAHLKDADDPTEAIETFVDEAGAAVATLEVAGT